MKSGCASRRAVFAGVSVVLSAIYTLNMVQKVAYGEVSEATQKINFINKGAQWALIILLIIVFASGVYPKPLFDLTADTLQQMFVK